MKIFYRLSSSLVLLFFSFSLLSLFPNFLRAQEPDEETIITDDVIVTAKKIPVLTLESVKNVLVISSEELQNLPAENIQDILGYYSGIDVKKRGPGGVQADISIRGGSFEQTLILIDGVKLSDPQTGHNNLNLPINMEDIERIEVLKGQASNIYGSNALSGVINIITKKTKNDELLLNASAGENGFYKGGLFLSYGLGKLSNSISFSKENSNGYRHNTDFDIITTSYNSSLRFDLGSAGFSVGYTDKKFGANGFYSDRYPNQWEGLKTLYSSFVLNLGVGNFSISPKLYLRNNKDNYLLDYLRPYFYKNEHKTNSYGIELQSSFSLGFLRLSFGGELSYDDIQSSNLGNHDRQKGGISLAAIFTPFDRLKIAAGGFVYNYDNFGWKYWPGVDLEYQLVKGLNLTSSIGKSFRIPTFTELYYNSPAQIGNPLLRPEEAFSMEAGLSYSTDEFFGNFNIFSRQGSSLIDWIRYSSDKPWMAENITKINTTGLEASFSVNPIEILQLPIEKIKFGYTYLNSDLKLGNYQSRYIMDHLKHQFTAEVMHPLIFDIKANWAFRYEDRLSQQEYFIVDTKILYSLSNYEFFLEATNLLNKYYMDFSGIPMPGRWIIGGIKFRTAL
ncbi:MAG: TonB-dependent receptor [Bacteroidota bacterium]|nr:TonB-dependent receptor [Bacteroidota bacterium]MDP4194211.1 TonB-dependent receptor [Bacteroidota bacterium]